MLKKTKFVWVMSMMLALVLAMASLIPMTENVYGANTKVKYKVDGGNIYFDTQTGTIEDSDKTVISAEIPEKIQGKTVKAIGSDAFRGCIKLTDVVIPDSVTDLGEAAFYACSSLKEIKIPGSIRRIEFYTFVGCSSLEKVEIADGVIGIGSESFAGCTSLTEIEIPNSVYYLESFVFYECENLKKVTIPDSVNRIADAVGFDGVTIHGYSGTYAEAFAKENNISFVAEESISADAKDQVVNQIGDFVLMVETKVAGTAVLSQVKKTDKKVVEITDTAAIRGVKYELTTIDSKAFSKCQSMKTVTLPSTITQINKQAFTGANKLKTVNLKISQSIKVKKGAFKDLDSGKIIIKVSKKMSNQELKKFRSALKKAGFKGSVKKAL